MAACCLRCTTTSRGRRERPRCPYGDIAIGTADLLLQGGDGLGRDEQRLRDLAVGPPGRRQPGDSQLTGSQCIAAGDRIPARLGSGLLAT